MLVRQFSAQGAVTIFLIIVGAVVARGAQQPHGGHRQWMPPAEAARRTNPLANRTDVEAGGEKLFRQRCATCHGEDGRGGGKAPNLAASRVQAQSDGALFWKITSGNTRTGMPTFSFLPEPQRWQLVLKLRRLPAQAVSSE